MKRKVKKFNAGEMVTSRGGDTNIRRRTDDEIAADNKAGYGRNMPKTKEYTFDEVKDKLSGLFGGKKVKEEVPIEERSKPVEERPTSSGVEDYASLGKRFGAMPAKSTMSGPIEDIKPEKAESNKVKAEGPFAGFDAEKALKESKPTGGGSTSTTGGGSGSKSSGGSKGSTTNRRASQDAAFPKNTNKNNVVPDNYKLDDRGPANIGNQSFAKPKSGRGPDNTFLTKDRSDSAQRAMRGERDPSSIPGASRESTDSHLANEFKRRPRAKDDEDYATKKKRERAGKDVRANSAVYGIKKGGAVKSASARADGIAIRGKTRA